MRIAAIDIGSNSIHLVVVEADTVGNQRVLTREKSMVRLAKGIARNGEINPESFQAGLETLALMAEVIRGFHCDTVIARGTAALREASNARRFIEEAALLDIPIRVISGEEEARLIFLAVRHAIPFPEEPAVLVDIGGGSTELTWVHGERVFASLSLPWGVQRLADSFPTSDPPIPEDLKRVRKCLRRLLKQAAKQLPEQLPKVGLMLGTSGTLLDLAKGANPGPDASFSQEQLLRFKRKLWHASARDRIEQLGVDPKRAEGFHLGASWALGIMDWFEIPVARCLPVGLREGMIWEALKHGGIAVPALPERRRAAIEALAAKLDPDPSHSLQVRKLADRLFLDLQPVFELGDPERELLSHAAQLHDIGLSVAEKDHHKHGAYLIQNADLLGFWRKETELIAQTVRFHRGTAPTASKHEGYAQLAPWHQGVVEKMVAILRAADALDRGRRQAVQSARISLEGDEAVLRIEGTGDLRPELESLQDKGMLLFHLLDRPVRTVVTERRNQLVT
jgi:exopolyphosphatase/guanosine-5'-triphosphate,3'-diphosphate pyrophosphatase